jgi:BolA protein
MIEVKLKDILEKTFGAENVEVINESHLHASHAGSPQSGDSHFTITVRSKKFDGLSRIEQHQMINNVIAPLYHEGLHAISMQLSTT